MQRGQAILEVCPFLLVSFLLPVSSAALEQELVTPSVIAPPGEQVASPGDAASHLSRLTGAQVLADLYMDDERSYLGQDLQRFLLSVSNLLSTDSRLTMVIEAHCDERDTGSYSLALGAHRAFRIHKFLTDLGVPEEQIVTISYGRERMFCDQRTATCFEDNTRLRDAFGVLAVSHSRRGCLARLQVIHPTSPLSLQDLSADVPSLRRILVAEPSPGWTCSSSQ